jgi:hypothetical protein
MFNLQRIPKETTKRAAGKWLSCLKPDMVQSMWPNWQLNKAIRIENVIVTCQVVSSNYACILGNSSFSVRVIETSDVRETGHHT